MATVAAATFGDNWTKFHVVIGGDMALSRCRTRNIDRDPTASALVRTPASAVSCSGVIPVTSDLADRLPSCVGPRAIV